MGPFSERLSLPSPRSGWDDHVLVRHGGDRPRIRFENGRVDWVARKSTPPAENEEILALAADVRGDLCPISGLVPDDAETTTWWRSLGKLAPTIFLASDQQLIGLDCCQEGGPAIPCRRKVEHEALPTVEGPLRGS